MARNPEETVKSSCGRRDVYPAMCDTYCRLRLRRLMYMIDLLGKRIQAASRIRPAKAAIGR